MMHKIFGRILPLFLSLVLILNLAVVGNGTAVRSADNESAGIRLSAGKEYPLYWPDILTKIDKDAYTKVKSVVKVTRREEVDKTVYRGQIRLDRDYFDQLEAYVEYVQKQCHFKLVSDEDDAWYFRFQGSNAPVTLSYGDIDYHCSLIIKEETKKDLLIEYLWLTDFSTTQEKASMTPKQIASAAKSEKTEPSANKKVETKSAETKPAVKKVKTNDDLKIQDPSDFFGCARYEDLMIKRFGKEVWCVSCKFDLDTGKQVISELIALLSKEYPFELTRAVKGDYISSSAKIIYDYYLDYTGGSSLVDEFQHENLVAEEMISCDLQLGVVCDYRAGSILLAMYFDPDFTLESGEYQASVLPVDYGGMSKKQLESVSNPNWNKNVLTCTACDGTGDCSKCNSSGYLWSSASDSNDRNCWRCNNSGVCQTCYGSGKR